MFCLSSLPVSINTYYTYPVLVRYRSLINYDYEYQLSQLDPLSFEDLFFFINGWDALTCLKTQFTTNDSAPAIAYSPSTYQYTREATPIALESYYYYSQLCSQLTGEQHVNVAKNWFSRYQGLQFTTYYTYYNGGAKRRRLGRSSVSFFDPFRN